MADRLTKAQCILLAVNHASEAKIDALTQLIQLKSSQVFPQDLVLRILLTFLPEVVPPAQYASLVSAITSGHYGEPSSTTPLDVAPVSDVSEATADKRLRKLTLLPLRPPSYPVEAPQDLLAQFICHRAHLIDQEIGLLSLVPDLVTPFLPQSEFLRFWYMSTVLPLLRLRTTFYPDRDLAPNLTLHDFSQLDGVRGTAILLSGADDTTHEITSNVTATGTVGRDLKGAVGPWIYGNAGMGRWRPGERAEEQAQDIAGRIERPNSSWEPVFDWLVKRAVNDFPMVTSAFENWDGPKDVDLIEGVQPADILSEAEREDLRYRYNQFGFAACFAVEANTPDAISGSHGVLVRLAELMDFEPPPELATSVDQLPRVDEHLAHINRGEEKVLLELTHLMDPHHVLTAPSLEAYMFLQMLVYSAHQLAGLGHSVSIVNVAQIRLFSTEDEQLALVRRLLHGLVQNGHRDEYQWLADRGRILWLWDWNVRGDGDGRYGSGIFGKIPREQLDTELFTSLLATGNYGFAERMYLHNEDPRNRLTEPVIEELIVAEAMKCFDNASNGNRNRGNMKKAYEIISSFRLTFPKSTAFDQAQALIAAANSMSYYSLTLQHKVPFQPVNIRVAQDPLSLIEHILDQNQKSYTKLDDFVSIGRNLTIASPSKVHASIPHDSDPGEDQASLITYAERRVTFMCISAALTAQDFDTAYSYLTNRLSPPSSSITTDSPKSKDDISWRAAFLAGRWRASSTAPLPVSESIRRLEQRTELLSIALLLAPARSLTEILSVYRRCEEELSSLHAQQDAQDDAADKALGHVPGGFDPLDPDEGRVYGQARREMGRISAGGTVQMQQQQRGKEEAPVGLFDLAQGAAAALRRNAFPLRGGKNTTSSAPAREHLPSRRVEDDYQEGEDDDDAEEEDEEAWGWNADEHPKDRSEHQEGGRGEQVGRNSTDDNRVRKRDVVASAVTGSLASGLGWVLGATPVEQGGKR